MTSSKRRFSVLLLLGGLAGACEATATTPDLHSDGSDAGAAGALGPLDPGFTGTPPDVWTTSGGAAIETWLPPGVDPGAVRFDPAKIQGIAVVAQTFPMPTYALTQQYALESAGVGASVGMFMQARIDNVTIGDVAFGASASKSRTCLGERAFGHDVALAFWSRGANPLPGDATAVYLDHVAVVAAPDCPASGALLGGDFEIAGSWSTDAPSEIVGAGGPGTGHAAHLVVPSKGEAHLKHVAVSFPWKTMARPAIRLAAKGGGPPLGLRVDRLTSLDDVAPAFGWIRTTAAPATSTVCIPEWSKGFALPFSIGVSQPASGAMAEYFIDDVAFVSEPSCPESAFVLGGDFEGATASQYWAFADAGAQVAGQPPKQTSGIVSTGDAHGGGAHALLSVDSNCLHARMTQEITTPVAEVARGPAVKFWYRTSGAGKVAAGVDSGQRAESLPAAGSWTPHTFCLEPGEQNRPTAVGFGAYGAGGGCVDQPVETLAIDDVEVTTDPSCPVL